MNGSGVNGKVATDGIGGHGKATGTGGLTLGCVIAVKSVDFLVVATGPGAFRWATSCGWGCWHGDGRNLDWLVLGALSRAGLLGVLGFRTVLGVCCCLRERGVLVVEDEEDDD